MSTTRSFTPTADVLPATDNANVVTLAAMQRTTSGAVRLGFDGPLFCWTVTMPDGATLSYQAADMGPALDGLRRLVIEHLLGLAADLGADALLRSFGEAVRERAGDPEPGHLDGEGPIICADGEPDAHLAAILAAEPPVFVGGA